MSRTMDILASLPLDVRNALARQLNTEPSVSAAFNEIELKGDPVRHLCELVVVLVDGAQTQRAEMVRYIDERERSAQLLRAGEVEPGG